MERSFEIDDLVYLMLQPYTQSTLRKKGTEKLKPQYYGPFKVVKRVGEVAYELDLTVDSKVHNVFHVSRLKKALRPQVTPIDLPPLDDEGKLILIPEVILDSRVSSSETGYQGILGKVEDLPAEDATWESDNILQHPALSLIVDKQIRGGRTVMSPL